MWRSGHFSALGTSHKSVNAPCQDSATISLSNDNVWVAATVCDGAGSAKHAEDGARYVSGQFNKKLIELAERLHTSPPGGWVNDAIIAYVIEIRDGLRGLAKKDDIADYHTTLVAVLLGPKGGIAIHIGDGIVFAGKAVFDKNSNRSLIDDFVVSTPENGEYANETYFITESTWLKHLRILPLPDANWAVLATDGGAEFLYETGGTHPSGKAFARLLTRDTQSGAEPPTSTNSTLSGRLEKYLTDQQHLHLTADDKTVAVIIHDQIAEQYLDIKFQEPSITIDRSELTKDNTPNIISPQGERPPPSGSPTKDSTRLQKIFAGFLNQLKCRWRWLVLFFGLLLSATLIFWSFQSGIFNVEMLKWPAREQPEETDTNVHTESSLRTLAIERYLS